MARQPSAADRDRAYPAWRIGFLPVLALLGAVLPLVFVPQLEDFLYYLRPIDLLPAYGTAWLFLAALALPIGLIATLTLKGLGTIGRLRPVRDVLGLCLIGVAGAAALGGLLYCLLTWVQTFGWLQGLSFRQQFIWCLLPVGALIAGTQHGRSLVDRLRAPLAGCLLFGALCVLTVPIFGWSLGAPLAPLRDRGDPPLQSSDPPATAPDPPASTPQRARPHIVLLTIDALSAEHMSLYGATRPTTPMLAAFAQGATTFERAYANANFTTPGVASILTGTRPWSHRALQLPSWPQDAARSNSLPALLQQSGYQTGYVSTNAVAGATKNGLGSYFDFASRDRIRDVSLCTDGLSWSFKYACSVAAMPLFGELISFVDNMRGGRDNLHYDPRLAIEPALAWLSTVDKNKPIFLWVHLFPPHSPYAAPMPWLGRFDPSSLARGVPDTEPHWGFSMGSVADTQVQTLSARYDESVEYADYYCGQFLARALQILGPNTVVIVTADHGESFRHGYGAHTGPGLFDEIIRVPLIIKLPGQTRAIRSSSIAEQVDIAPTVAALLDLRPPSGWEGHSLLAAWSSASATSPPASTQQTGPAFSMNFEQNHRFSTLATGSIAIIEGDWKLVHYMGRLHYPQMPALQDELYDLSVDPGEAVNRAADQPAEVLHLRSLIDAQLARHGGAVK